MAEGLEEERDSPSMLQMAVTLGVGYVAFNNRKSIINQTKKLLSKGTTSIVRGSNNQTYKGVISQAKNLNKAMDEMISYSPRGMLRNLKRPGFGEELGRRTAAYNKTAEGLKGRNPLKSIANKTKVINSDFAREATAATRSIKADKVFAEGTKMGDALGPRRNTARMLYEENQEKFHQIIRSKDKTKGLDFDLYDIINKSETDPTSNLKLDFASKEDRQGFVNQLLNSVEEIDASIKLEVADYQSHLKQPQRFGFPDNDYAKQMELYQMAGFQAVRQDSIPSTGPSFIQKVLGDNIEQITMKDAKNLRVKESNGRLFAVQSDDKELLQVQNAFNEPRREKISITGQKTIKVEENFADKYIEQGVKYGLDKEKLETDIFSTNLYIDRSTGELLDVNAPKRNYQEFLEFADGFQIPYINIAPSRFLPGQSREGFGEQFFHIMEGGKDVQSLVKGLSQVDTATDLRNVGARTQQLSRSYLFMNDSIVDSKMADTVAGATRADRFSSFMENLDDFKVGSSDEFVLVNAKTGRYARMAEAYSGRTNRTDLESRNFIQKFLKLGGQENQSNFGTMKDAFNKFKDPYYGANAIDTMSVLGADDLDGFRKGIFRVQDNLLSRTKNFSSEAQAALYDPLNQAMKQGIGDGIDLKDMTTDEGLLSIVERISEKYKSDAYTPTNMQDAVRFNMGRKLNEKYNYQVLPNQQETLTRNRFLKSKKIYQSDMDFMFDDYSDTAVSGADDLRRMVEQYAISEADAQGMKLASSIYGSTDINKKSVETQLSSLRSLSEASYFSTTSHSKDLDVIRGSVANFKNYYEEGSIQRTSLEVALRDADPWYGSGSVERQDKILRDTKYLAVKKHQSPLEFINRQLAESGSSEYIDTTDRLLNQSMDTAKGLFKWSRSFLAGSEGDVSTATMTPWFMANRLDSTLQQWGLGLPGTDRQSPAGILAKQFGYRIALPYIGFQYATYLDGLTGDRVSDTAADTYVNAQLGLAGVKEFSGFNEFGRNMERIMPWTEQIKEIPIVKGFNIATLGAFSEFRDKEDLEEYYVSGEDAVRKGRYWGVGSNSPWMGDRITHFEPNWYRKMKSDYQFTEDMYGSEKEYWANHWLPTPTNPLAPIKHFITDPYHYEEKHADSRPYVLTGGFSELEAIPLIGPAVNRVAQTILKPEKVNPKFEAAHQAYLTQQNEMLVESYIGMNAGGTLSLTPTSMKLHSNQTNVSYLDEDTGLIDEESLILNSGDFNTNPNKYITGVLNGLPGGKLSGEPLSTDSTLIPGSGEGGPASYFTSGNYSQLELAQINQNLTDGRTTNRNDNILQAGTLHNPNQIQGEQDWANANALFSMQGVARDIRYNASEMAGMYGFLTNLGTGFDEKARKPVLESSERFGSYSEKFWDTNLGGLGGDASEIFRRYFARDKNNYYNPIKNEMPDFMPGSNYFIDFQHGDPFRKVPHGEMRLPGSGYDALYNTKKDQYGNYSAFDRYRILSDVAPYSDEYRLARKEMSLMNQNGMLDEGQQKEYAEIRKQVSAKMKKKNFYDTRFENADVESRTVTVDKVIDQNTFITKEYPNNPFKFAGITIRAEDEANIDLVNQMLKPGRRVQVEIDKNPQQRIRDDMMDTMRVVVYAPENEEGSLFGFQGLSKGQNMNYYLSKQDEVSVKDDNSATSTRALFSDGQHALGRISDAIVHDIMPSIPILNVVAEKYLAVDTAVEAYEKEIFSKSWRSWDNPITGWMNPMIENTMSRNPLTSALHGAGIGALTYRRNRWKGSAVAALAFGTLSGVRTLFDASKDVMGPDYDIWKPKRREKEFEINEYFDRLQYIKYKGLYAKTSELAERYEGVNLDAIMAEQELIGDENGGLKEYLNNEKKWLTIGKKSSGRNKEDYDHQLSIIREDLAELEADDSVDISVGAYTSLALRYKDAYESTLYAAATGETYDYNKIYRALPSKDKPYFTEFQKASPKDRRRILELVPDNQRPLYQRYFGEDVDQPLSNEEYFQRYQLPDEDWAGWEPNQSLDNAKIKVMKQEGVELTEANYWPDDEKIADESGLEPIEMKRRNLSGFINTGELQKILQGAGLQNVHIGMTIGSSEYTEVNAQLNIQQHREFEVESGMRDYLAYQ